MFFTISIAAANTAVQQLNYLTKYDFTPVKHAATQALDKLGEKRERVHHTCIITQITTTCTGRGTCL